jgi:hypothetical protein
MNGTERGQVSYVLLGVLVGAGIILLLLLWIATLVVSWYLGSDPVNAVGDVVLLSVLVMPILIYAIISDKLKVIRGPGGFGAEFNRKSAEPISKKLNSVRVSVDDGTRQILSSGKTQTLGHGDWLSNHETQPIFMNVTFGNKDYTPSSLRDEVESHFVFRSFEIVVFLTSDGYFLGSMPAWAAKQALNDPKKSQKFVDLIKSESTELLSWPGVIRKGIPAGATNAEALREMVEHNSRVIVVTDEKNHVRGIAEREQVIGRMMLALTDSSLQRG